MNLSRIFDIAGSGMTAQSVRMNTVASNLANAQTSASSEAEAYKAKQAVFQTVQQQASGDLAEASNGVEVVEIVESNAPADKRYEPDHPDADAEGYVYYSNVNVVEEMANMIAASKAFNAEVEVMNTTKSMLQRVLTLGQG
jgi:flagellar basal-body rod protein FlgC